MFKIFAGSNWEFENLSPEATLIIVLGLIVYLAFWALMIFLAYKTLRKFLISDARGKKQIGIAVFIILIPFVILPITAGIWGWASQNYYQWKYDACVEKYTYPSTPKLQNFASKTEIAEYQKSDLYINCHPLQQKAY